MPSTFAGRSFYLTITLADIIDHVKYPNTKPFKNEIDIRVEIVEKNVKTFDGVTLTEIDADEVDSLNIRITNISEDGTASLKFESRLNLPPNAEAWTNHNEGSSYFDFRFVG